MRAMILCGVGLMALAANTTTAHAAMQAPVSEDQAADASAPDADEFAPGEIIVTAERRSQSIQKSSLAISVLSVDKMADAGLVETRDITKLEPGVQIGQGGPATQIYIRGVGDFGSTAATNPAVATNIDGVYISRSNAINGNFYDLARVEVLKGPQGTLYGRNASGGAINIITNAPSFSGFSGRVEAEVGNYGLLRSTGFLNIPLSDTLAVRGAYQVISRNGYTAGGFDDDESRSARLSLLWEPSSSVSLRVTADYSHVGGVGPGYVLLDPAPAVAAKAAAAGFVLNGSRETVLTPNGAGVVQAATALSPAGCQANGTAWSTSTASGTFSSVPGGAGVVFKPQFQCAAGFYSTAPDYLNLANLAKQDNRYANIAATLDWNFGPATLTLVPAYRSVRNNYVVFPFLAFPVGTPDRPDKSDTYSLEARLGNNGPKLTWVLGGYIYREDQDAPSTLAPEDALVHIDGFPISGPNINTALFKTKSEAIFAQATYSVTDSLRLILGGRYTHDNKTLDYTNFVYDNPVGIRFRTGQACFGKPSPCNIVNITGETSSSKVSYKVGAEYDLGPQNMLFVTYATGLKAGGLNAAATPNSPPPPVVAGGGIGTAQPYGPERLAALEIGSRNRFLDNRVTLNLGAFYWKYKDSQQFITYLSAGTSTNALTNAGAATMYGANASAVVKLSENDTFSAAVEYLHTKFDRFTYTASLLNLPGGVVTSGCNVTGSVFAQTVDCSGKPLPRAPKWAGSANYMHSFDLGSAGSLDASVNVSFSSSRYLDNSFTDQVKAQGYASGDIVLTYRSPDDRWSLSGYVRNVTDVDIYTGGYTIPALFPGVALANISAPRTFGARVAVNF